MAANKINVGWLTPNRACNNRCSWCYAKSTNFNDKILGLELAEKLINLLKELGVETVIILGGEPTLYKHLPDLIKKIINAGIQPAVVSNGRRFADFNYAKTIANTGINSVGFSIKGANKQQYLELTGRDGYDEMMRGRHNLDKLGVETEFSVTLVNGIIESMEELVDSLIKEKVKKISWDIGSPILTKNGAEAINIADPITLARAIENLYKIMEKSCMEYDIFLNIPLCLLPDYVLKGLRDNNRAMSCCQIQTKSGVIFDQEGRVLPCNAFCDYPIGKFGVDFNDAKSFQKFWDSEEMKRLEKTLIRYPSKLCSKCDWWEICGGGCPIKWMYWDPKKFIKGRR
ncbi:MAG: radical SAM protein [Patescibacteria group bacterium]|jgi:radical SAM protein with 4Fe4S-binding SPASM domain